VTTVVVLASVVIVIVIPPWLPPNVASTVIAAPALDVLSYSVWRSVAPVKLHTGFVVWRTANSPTTLQEGEILHYLDVIVKEVDMPTLEVNQVIVMWQLPVWLSHREPNLGGDVAGVAAPSPEVE